MGLLWFGHDNNYDYVLYPAMSALLKKVPASMTSTTPSPS